MQKKKRQYHAETKEYVQNQLDRYKLRELAEKLTTEHLTINEDYAAVADKLSHFLEDTFPDFTERNMAIVVVGSGVHGGSEVRKHFNPTSYYEDADLDWVLLYDQKNDHKSYDAELRRLMVDSAVIPINYFGRNTGFGAKFKSCDNINPKREWVYNIPTTEAYLEKSVAVTDHTIKKWAKETLLYFYPSYPPHINEKNRAIVLHVLKRIHQTDPAYWKKLVSALMTQWKKRNDIKEKHITTENVLSPTQRISQNSHNARLEPFFVLLTEHL